MIVGFSCFADWHGLALVATQKSIWFESLILSRAICSVNRLFLALEHHYGCSVLVQYIHNIFNICLILYIKWELLEHNNYMAINFLCMWRLIFSFLFKLRICIYSIR